MCRFQSWTGSDPAITTIWKLYLQVGEYQLFPLARTVVLEALNKSSPTALGDPRVGDRACSVSLTKRSRGEDDDENIFLFVNTSSVDLNSFQYKLRTDRW